MTVTWTESERGCQKEEDIKEKVQNDGTSGRWRGMGARIGVKAKKVNERKRRNERCCHASDCVHMGFGSEDGVLPVFSPADQMCWQSLHGIHDSPASAVQSMVQSCVADEAHERTDECIVSRS